MLALFTLPQASTLAKNVDQLFNFILTASLISFVAVIAAIVYFLKNYHRRKSDPDTTPYIEGHPVLEAIVMTGLFFLVMFIFAWGWIDYQKMRTAPANSLEINVLGRQWSWEFEYTNGRKMLGEIVVPNNQPIKLLMTASDVLHSFFIPDFRVKQDLVPGTYTMLWFQPTQLGEFQVFCAEYCGTSHSGMLAKIRVVEPEEYEKWQKKWEWEKMLGVSPSETPTATAKTDSKNPAPVAASTESPAERGKKLFETKGCTACHTVNGQTLVGPTLKGIFGHEVEFNDGKKTMADENYVRESIMDPNLKVVKGFQPLMPTFKGTLTDDEINALVAYVKSLGN